MGDACDRGPYRRLPGRFVLVGVHDLRWRFGLSNVYGLRFPFSSYS